MKRVFVAVAATALGTAIYLPAAFAGDAVAGAAEADAAALTSRAPHYEWQYHYVGSHHRYEGYWARVR